MFTNYDAQQIINSNVELDHLLYEMRDIQPGSGETTIHLYALKQLLLEIKALRNK
jgi:hypothetical protein